uniref:UV excision repair protein RAD23 n=1 Tax=Panagrolaimus superbus TaxID=310955 RepID=A0A914XTE2_9BILA
MGYPKSDALAALRAAFFDQGRAVEYLINGIPKTLSKNNSSIEASEDGENVGLDFLQHNAAFGQIRQMVQKNPEILSEVIQKIAALNPPLMSVIKKNEREFLELLNSDSPIVAAPSDSVNPQQQHGNGSGNVVGRREHIVEVTEEERDAINRVSIFIIKMRDRFWG